MNPARSQEARPSWSGRTWRAALVGIALAALWPGQEAGAQRVTGKEATVPDPPPRPRTFRLEHPRANTFLFSEGDPKVEDAPRVVAVAGGGELWFEDIYVTARNLLLWTDPEALPEPEPPAIPHVVSPPRTGSGLPAGFTEGGSLLPTATTLGTLREVYAEGDVYVRSGRSTVIQADKMYFNLIEDRSLIVGGEIRTDLSSFNLNASAEEADEDRDGEPAVPIVIRAAEIRGVAKGLYEADNASFTTSTFGKPGYHVAVDRLVYEERALELGGRLTGTNNRLVLGDTSVLSVPHLTVRTGVESPFPLIGIGVGASSRYGAFLETRWGSVFQQAGLDFNKALGIEGDFEGLWYTDVNLYSKRGLGLGAGVQYETSENGETRYFGETRAFFINDLSGDDETGSGDNSGLRGQFKTQNRVFLPEGWQFDSEINYVSDREFLREFLDDEADEEKEPETLAYFKKIEGDTAVSALARFRLNDWQTQTQYLPQFTYDVVSRPIAEFDDFAEFLDQVEPVRLYWTHRSETAIVNRTRGDEGEGDEGTAFRIDDVERLNLPFEVGNVGFDPYLEGRFTSWLGDGEDGSGAFRTGLTFGFNASTQFWRVDPDVESEFWNIHGIRHIVIPSLRYRWTFLSSVDSNDLVPYDRVERFDALHALVPGVLNRYQTKRQTRRGPETVTFLEYDIQQPLVFDNARDEDIETVAPLYLDARYRPDLDRYLLRNSYLRTSLNLGWDDFGLDSYRAEFYTEPGPDFYARVAYSYARRGRIDPTLLFEGFPPENERRFPLNALTFEVAWQATRLWEFVVLQQFDISGEGGGESRLVLRRRTADWLFEFGFGAQASGLGTGFGITVSPIAFFEREERERFKTVLSDGYDLTPVIDEPPFAYGPALEPGPPVR